MEAITPNRVKLYRLRQGWSQEELARRAAISRSGISAIEVGRLVPSVVAAMGLASALRCTVEELFGLPTETPSEPQWAWPPRWLPSRYWHARVGHTTWLYPAESLATGTVEHDGVFGAGGLKATSSWAPDDSLVLSCCDPAAALLAVQFQRLTPYRLLVVPASSGEALTHLSAGRVHVAGIHFGAPSAPQENAASVASQLGGGHFLLRVATWQEGLAVSTHVSATTPRGLLRSRLTWVGREFGSGARRCLEELLGDRPFPRRLARDHRGVAEAVRSGWAEVGVCVRIACEEAGLRFLPLRDETYDLCFSAASESDPRIQALVRVVRSESYRRQLADLPGYNTAETGDLHRIAECEQPG
jgi:molybdate-binding protein/DNA-binding XRE family transcriptional regulator